MKVLIVLIASLALVGCDTIPKKPDPRVVAFEAGKRKVELDKRYLKECPDLDLLKDSTDKDTLALIKSLGAKYQECRAWKKELNKIVRDTFNLEETK